jgi:hypothetical protein
MIPYSIDEKTWPHQQIIPFDHVIPPSPSLLTLLFSLLTLFSPLSTFCYTLLILICSPISPIFIQSLDKEQYNGGILHMKMKLPSFLRAHVTTTNTRPPPHTAPTHTHQFTHFPAKMFIIQHVHQPTHPAHLFAFFFFSFLFFILCYFIFFIYFFIFLFFFIFFSFLVDPATDTTNLVFPKYAEP